MFWSVALGTGAVCAALQAVLWLLFSRWLPDGVWRREPGFLSHQIIGLPLMVIITAIGAAAWFFPSDEATQLSATPEGRVLGYYPTSDLLASIILGELLLWDIPMTFVPSLYSTTTLAHHVGMAFVAVITEMPYLQHYVPFFGGLIELSSIPLQIVDVLHPKHFVEWTSVPWVNRLNSGCRTSFAVLFILTRTFYFPYVVLAQVLPDLGHLASTNSDQLVWATIAGVFACSFTALQLYWSSLIAKQIFKGTRKSSVADDAPPYVEVKG
ncbi:hypothetical protein AB1Y20_008861 [Prymnesium parvum]|uniref:TLC domain-containing protein n=1 Tax=Prymnesium parvum TaxID=97485 RepID=A0AB34ISQ1_PRYPA|mmetsp:Transcript_1547/g.3922  ORF Transcript_1547/g.3922 Transcript_1547/m.3922 type:complete len:268 (+) Transcript_1547:19-822(+)